jgi:hypothetical protein
MKTKFLRLISIFFLLLPVCVVLPAGCDDDEYSNLVEGYIVGSFACEEVNSEGQATGDLTERGYCILLEGSENADFKWPMDFYTFDLPSGLFEFPEEIILPGTNGNDCGPWFFPANSRSVYKIKFSYRVLNKKERAKYACGGCMAMLQPFPWDDYNEISLKVISKVN